MALWMISQCREFWADRYFLSVPVELVQFLWGYHHPLCSDFHCCYYEVGCQSNCWFFGGNLFFFSVIFLTFHYDVVRYLFLNHTLGFLSFLNLRITISSFWKFLIHKFFQYCFCLIPFFLPLRDFKWTYVWPSHYVLCLIFSSLDFLSFFLCDLFCIATLTTVLLLMSALPALLVVYMPSKRQVSCQSLSYSLSSCFARLSVND